MIDLSKEQIKEFARSILLSDIAEYINTHLEEYNNFVKNQDKD